MRLPEAFLRLPLDFEVEALAQALMALPESAWRVHPQAFEGNLFLPIVAEHGRVEDEGLEGPMGPTEHLDLPGIQGILEAFGSPLGRVRVMRLEPGCEVSEHVDIHPYWARRVRLHVPLQTEPEVAFYAGYEGRHMPAGSCWAFDTWRPHRVVHAGSRSRLHLVVDLLPGPQLEELFEAARRGQPHPGFSGPLRFEEGDRLDPGMLRSLLQDTRHEGLRVALLELVEALEQAPDEETRGFLAAHHLARLERFRGLRLDNGVELHGLLESWLPRGPREPAHIEQALVILSPPRSGSTALFELLAQAPGLFSIGGESHQAIEGLPGLSVRERGHHGLGELDETATAELRRRFVLRARDREGRAPSLGQGLHLLEKTPKNCLRLPMLRGLFPRMRVLVLWREPREVLASMIEGWRSGLFRTWPEEDWSFLAPPGWRQAPEELPERVLWQWSKALDGLDELPEQGVRWLRYEELCADPEAVARRVADWAGLGWDRSIQALPPSKNTLTPPAPGKWQRLEPELSPLLERASERAARALGRAVWL